MRTLVVTDRLENPTLGRVLNEVRTLPGISETTLTLFDDAEADCARVSPELVLVLLCGDPARGQEMLRNLRGRFVGSLLAIGHVADPKLILRALQLGADLFVDTADIETELQAAFSRLRNRPDTATPLGRLIAVLSASGGCGASTLAVNLAVVQAREQKSCALFDLNSGRGDLAALLDLKPRFSLSDVCLNESRMDDSMLARMMVLHTSGVHLLAASPDSADGRAVTTSGVRQALCLARRRYPETVVDLEDAFHPEQVEVLLQATGVILVSRLDFTALRHTRRILDGLGKVKLPRHQIKIVINQYGQPNELKLEDAEEAVGEKISAIVPTDPKLVNQANNTGHPAVLKAPTSKFATGIAALTRLDFGQPVRASGLTRNLRHLFGSVFSGST
jgi:pilus assembly protein CpaE